MTIRRTRWLLATALLLGIQAPQVVADEAVVNDEKGRIIRSVDESGNVVWYVYDETGTLIRERHSDGRVIHHDERRS